MPRLSPSMRLAASNRRTNVMAPNDLRALLLRYFDLLYSEQLDTLLDLFADEVHWFIVPTATEIRGKAQLRELAGNHWRASPDRVKKLVNVFAGEGFGCLEYTSGGTVTADADFVTTKIEATGRRYEVACCFVFHFRTDGKIDRVREYFDLRTVQQQLGGAATDRTGRLR